MQPIFLFAPTTLVALLLVRGVMQSTVCTVVKSHLLINFRYFWYVFLLLVMRSSSTAPQLQPWNLNRHLNGVWTPHEEAFILQWCFCIQSTIQYGMCPVAFVHIKGGHLWMMKICHHSAVWVAVISGFLLPWLQSSLDEFLWIISH